MKKILITSGGDFFGTHCTVEPTKGLTTELRKIKHVRKCKKSEAIVEFQLLALQHCYGIGTETNIAMSISATERV